MEEMPKSPEQNPEEKIKPKNLKELFRGGKNCDLSQFRDRSGKDLQLETLLGLIENIENSKKIIGEKIGTDVGNPDTNLESIDIDTLEIGINEMEIIIGVAESLSEMAKSNFKMSDEFQTRIDKLRSKIPNVSEEKSFPLFGYLSSSMMIIRLYESKTKK